MTVAERLAAQVIRLAETNAKYEAAIGRFVLVWSEAELALYKVMLRYAQIGDGVGRSVFSGTRAGGLINFIRAIQANTSVVPVARWDDLEPILAQFGSINTARDEIIHFASRNPDISGADGFVISNAERISRYANAYRKILTLETIESMIRDLRLIAAHLDLHTPLDREFQSYSDRRQKQTTWLYKPAQPEFQNPRKPSAPQSAQPLPPPSRE